MQILVVSEYKTRLEWMKRNLSAHEVLWAKDTEGVQNQLQLCPVPHAIVTDTHLRVVSGLHVLQMI